jgi:hypothetical protein
MMTGKSYIGRQLAEKHDWACMGFADNVKYDLEEGLPFTEEEVWSKDDRMRVLRQAYGEAMRGIDPAYWIHRLQADIEFILTGEITYDIPHGLPQNHIVIDDVRYPNELEWLRRFGANNDDVEVKIVRLERPKLDRTGIVGANHESETALDNCTDFDHVLTFGENGTQELDNAAFALSQEEFWSNE